MTPSPEQSSVFSFLWESTGNLLISACAGGGKTTTLVEALKVLPVANTDSLLPPSILFLSFNKAIAETLALRCPKHVLCSTFHALGFSALKRFLGKTPKVDGRKVAKLVWKRLHQDDPDVQNVIKLVDLLKQQSPEASGASHSTVRDLSAQYDVYLENEKNYAVALLALEQSNADLEVIDFYDMLYLPVLLGAEFQKQDWIFVDEAQDTNDIQLEILERLEKPSTRSVFVGDPHQAIYGFRGANSDSMSRISARFSCTSLPLSVSYRCPQSVVAEAQKALALKF